MQSEHKGSPEKLFFWFSVCFGLLFVIGVAQAVLGPVFFNDDPKQRPPVETLYGTYAPDAKSRKFIQSRYGKVDSSISIDRDGNCTMRNIPDCWNTPDGESRGTVKNLQGGWDLQGKSYVSVRTDHFYRHFRIKGQKPPYTIELYVGPEHENNSLRYVRTDLSKSP